MEIIGLHPINTAVFHIHVYHNFCHFKTYIILHNWDGKFLQSILDIQNSADKTLYFLHILQNLNDETPQF